MALEQLLPQRVVRRKPTLTVNAKLRGTLNSTVVEEMLPKDVGALCVFYDPETGQLVIEAVTKPGADAWPLRHVGKGLVLSLAVLARKHRLDIAGQRYAVTVQDDGCLAIDLNDGAPYGAQRGKD